MAQLVNVSVMCVHFYNRKNTGSNLTQNHLYFYTLLVMFSQNNNYNLNHFKTTKDVRLFLYIIKII